MARRRVKVPKSHSKEDIDVGVGVAGDENLCDLHCCGAKDLVNSTTTEFDGVFSWAVT